MLEHGDAVRMSQKAVEEKIPGCLEVGSGVVLREWETKDGTHLVDVVVGLSETTYHRDYVARA